MIHFTLFAQPFRLGVFYCFDRILLLSLVFKEKMPKFVRR